MVFIHNRFWGVCPWSIQVNDQGQIKGCSGPMCMHFVLASAYYSLDNNTILHDSASATQKEK